MAQQKREVEGVGLVTFQKRRGSKSIRIHLHGDEVKVTLPFFAPYLQAERFVKERRDWINAHTIQPQILTAGQYIGKNHVITVQAGSAVRTSVVKNELRLILPQDTSIDSQIVQSRLKKAAERVLKQESEELILPRVHDLALENDFSYSGLHFKKLKTRWGSCDQKNNLIFNIYLIQLPWNLIDYVIIHELSHTVHHNHSREFWAQVEKCVPDYKDRRKMLKGFGSNIVVS